MQKTLTQIALSSLYFRNLLPDWLSILRSRYPRSNPNVTKTPPTELIELGHFLTHPSLSWHYKKDPHNLMLLVLPWGKTPLFFGPLATEDNLRICPVAHALLSKDNQRLLKIQPIGSTTHPIWISYANTPKTDTTPVAPPDPTLFATNGQCSPDRRPWASTSDRNLPLPSFCTQSLMTTPTSGSSGLHPLQSSSALQQSTFVHSTDLWQPEPTLNFGEWEARVQLALRILPAPKTTHYHVKLTYRHPQLGAMLPLEKAATINEAYSPLNAQQHFSSLLAELHANFQQLFELANKTHQLFGAYALSPTLKLHNHGVDLIAKSPIAGMPLLRINLTLQKNVHGSSMPPDITLDVRIHCKLPEFATTDKQVAKKYPIQMASISAMQVIQQVCDTYQQAAACQLMC